jgi:hypothetical protein
MTYMLGFWGKIHFFSSLLMLELLSSPNQAVYSPKQDEQVQSPHRGKLPNKWQKKTGSHPSYGQTVHRQRESPECAGMLSLL